jgi:enoyl-CoA hydratase
VSTHIDTAIDDGVAVITINRPEARNALSSALRSALHQIIEDLQHEDSAGAIVLTGADPVFSAGVDVKEMAADPSIARSVGPRLGPLFTSRKPLIGAINGPALTGGLELALACDWIIASDRAVFGDSHIRLGVTPGWGMSVLLSEAIGSRRAKQLLTTGERIDAVLAREWGLVNEVVPHELLLSRAIEQGKAVAASVPHAVSTILDIFREQRTATDAQLWAVEARHFIDPTGIGSSPKTGPVPREDSKGHRSPATQSESKWTHA